MRKIKQLDADLHSSFLNYSQTSEFERIREKFRKKPYECNQSYKTLANVIGFLCGCGSVAMAYTFAAEWITDKIERLPFASVVSVCIAVVCLVVLEVVQRLAINTSIRDYFTQGLQMKNALQLVLSIAITVFSVCLSYWGSFDMVDKLSKEPPQYVAPTLESTQEIKSRYGEQIATAKQNATAFFKARSYNGKIGDKYSNDYADLLKKVSNLQDDMNTQILRIQGINDTRKAQAKADYEILISQYRLAVNSKGQNLGIITLVLQCIFFLCTGYSQNYDYRVRLQYNDRILLEEEKTYQANMLLHQQQIPTLPVIPKDDNSSRMRVVGFSSSNRANNHTSDNKSTIANNHTSDNKSTIANNHTSDNKNRKRRTKDRNFEVDLKISKREIKKRIGTYSKRFERAKNEGKEKTSADNLARTKYWEYVLEKKELLAT